MAMFRLNPSYGVCPEMMVAQVSFTDPNSPAAANTGVYANKNQQVNPAYITVSLANGAYIGSDATVKPPRNQQLFSVYAYPQGGVAAYSGNANTCPVQNITTTAPVAGEYVIDFSGFQGDIVNVGADLTPQTRGVPSAPQTVIVSAVDNVNKLIYVQVLNAAETAGQWQGPAALVNVTVTFCDSYVA